MRDELKKYADEAYAIVETAANEIGPRLPGSDNERKFAEHMAGKLKEIGIDPVTEKFLVAPRASIGGIPYAGWVGIIAAILMLIPFGTWGIGFHGLAFFMCCATLVWLVCSVFLYKTWFDFAFKQAPSQNVYGELLPESGKYDYTVMLSAHTDTSWNWKHSAATKYRRGGPVPAFVKMGIGIVAFLFIFASAATVFITELQYAVYGINGGENMSLSAMETMLHVVNSMPEFNIALFVLIPLFVIPGCFLVTMWADKNPRTASPGAMDNATGIAIAYTVTKYFKENPDKLPEGCRIIDFNCGSEEAGLRGSIEFTRRHKGEDILKNCWNINIDSIADKDHFQVIHGDTWQFTRFDADLGRMLKEAMKDAGIAEPGDIANPVGGCDSTPFTKAGVKSITFAAQNPILTHYYHTFHDRPERFEKETVGMGIDVVLRLIDKIAAAESGKASAPAAEAAAPVADAAVPAAEASAPEAEVLEEVTVTAVPVEEVSAEEVPAATAPADITEDEQ